MGSRVPVEMLELFPNATGQVPSGGGEWRGKIPCSFRNLSSCVFGE